MVLAEPPADYFSIENRGPGADGGVEILVKFSDGRVWGWQSKYFPDSFSTSEVSQLKKSYRSALTNFPKLERYYVAVPRNLSGHAEGDNETQTKAWNGFKKWCSDEAAKLNRSISIELWDESYFVSRLQRNDTIYAGMRLYWFNDQTLSDEWFKSQLTRSFAYIGKRYRPSDHVAVGIANTIQALRRDEGFKRRMSHVSQCVTDAISVLQSLTKAVDKVDQLTEHFISLSLRLEEIKTSLLNCDRDNLYAPLLSETLSKCASIRYDDESYRALNDAQYEQIEPVSADAGKSEFKYVYSDGIRGKIDRFLSEIGAAGSEFTSLEIKLLRQPTLLVDGAAGVGKSHLLANEVEAHIDGGNPALFIPARVLDHGDRPEHELLRYLDIGDIRFETFLSALHSAALASGSPVLLAIDGINESYNASGWEAGLPSLIAQIGKFNRIALCVSIRSSYRNLCIRGGLEMPQISHYGFQGHLGEAAKEYLDRNGIERPSAPVFGLSEILYNPLFLSTAVDHMKATGLTSFPRGMDSIATLMSFWLDAVEQNLVAKGFDRISLNDEKIPKILKMLALEMATSGSEFVAYERVHKICEDVVDLAPPAKQSERLLPRLIDEGLLLDFPHADSDTGKRVSFGFQKFSDYFFADAILSRCKTTEVLAKELMSDGQYGYLFSSERFNEFSGPRVALLALTPVRLGCEIPHLTDNFTQKVSISVDEFLDSLVWRHGHAITEETVKLLERERESINDKQPSIEDERWFDLLLVMAPLSDCPINASYLKRKLASLDLGVRDATWSVYLVGKAEIHGDDWPVVHQLIDWAWVAPKSEIEMEKVHQVAIAIALMTSTTDRELRDCATKALASLLIKFPSVIEFLINEFADWDDSYVRERVLAAASAGVLYCENLVVLKAAALAADRMVFQKLPVERHAWTRRYAQIIVSHAVFYKAGIDEDLVLRSTPPYASAPISDWLSLEQIVGHSEDARSIFSSVVGYISMPFDGKKPAMAGDFGRYVMGGIDNHFSDSVRGDRQPMLRKDEVRLFWDKVDGLDAEAQRLHSEILELSELRETVGPSKLLQSVKEDDDSEGGNDDPNTPELSLEARFLEVEQSLFELLPLDLEQEYRRLQPLNKFRGDDIPMFSLERGQFWVFNRTIELGWQQSLHENVEKNRLGRSRSRHDHHVERIGKKYQHIAFAELVGYLADHHWYVDWGQRPRVLTRLEDFQRADIDATYLSSSFSKPILMHKPDAMCVPEMKFVPKRPASNMAWTKNLKDIPDPVQILIQSDSEGDQWCLQKYFCRSDDYMKGFESADPFRSAQFDIELILVAQADLEKVKSLTSEKIKKNGNDVFENSWSSASFFGQRSFRHQASAQTFLLSYEAADFEFGRITESYSPKYSEYDNSGVSEDVDFSTPHPALLAELNLRPQSGWSNVFLAPDGTLVFFDSPAFLGGIAVIRRDFIEKFASDHNLKVVWRVWVEKDGGLGSVNFDAQHRKFARNDFIGFYFEEGGAWFGNLIPFRD